MYLMFHQCLYAADFNISKISISRDGFPKHEFVVELATTEEEKSLGLMFRKNCHKIEVCFSYIKANVLSECG